MSGGLEKGNVISAWLQFRIMHQTTDNKKEKPCVPKNGIEKVDKATRSSEMEPGRKTDETKSL